MNVSRAPTTMAGNGPAPAEAASLYVGEVMHARLKPVGHRFSYRVTSLLIDLDRLDEADRASRLFSVDRFNLYAFHQKDHGDRSGAPLRPQVDRMLAAVGVARPERVLLLAYPRVLGYVFNPLSVYFAYDAAGRPSGVVYEVRNTFGELHAYALPVAPGEAGPEGIRQEQDKRFHVSPFIDMRQRYRFRILPPGAGIRVRILETDRDGPTLAATFTGIRRALTTGALASVAAAMPLHTLKVIAGIHYEAARLYLKGAPYHPHAGTPSGSSPVRPESPAVPAE